MGYCKDYVNKGSEGKWSRKVVGVVLGGCGRGWCGCVRVRWILGIGKRGLGLSGWDCGS